MATECYAMVRGSAIRVTALDSRGAVPDPVRYAASKAIAKVTIDEVTDQKDAEILRNPEDKRRLRLPAKSNLIRHVVSIQFLRVDPEVLSVVAGVPIVRNAQGNIVGFDATSRLAATSFALEVWSKLDQAKCATSTVEAGGETGFGEGEFGDTPFGGGSTTVAKRTWGYTLLANLRGGYLTGFVFSNGLVSFNLVKASTRKSSRWGVGPHDLTGPFERLLTPVSRNTSIRIFSDTIEPPVQTDGVKEFEDVISNGNAANPMPYPEAPLVVSGGNAASTSPYIISGGQA